MKLDTFFGIQDVHTKFITEASATARTALQESLHCVGIGIYQTKGSLTEEWLLDGGMFHNSFKKYCSLGGLTEDAIYSFAQSEPTWVTSVVHNVTALMGSSYTKGKYICHRGDAFMSAIYTQAKVLLKQAGYARVKEDKWNPGDIWLSQIKSIDQFDDIGLYNDWIAKKLVDGVLLGVSLKKSSGSATVSYIDQGAKKPFLRYRGTKKPDGPYNVGIEIKSNKGFTINIRSFNMPKGDKIQTEILVPAGVARHGKAPSTLIENEYGIKLTPKSKIPSDIEMSKKMVQQLWKDNGYFFSDKQMNDDWTKRRAGNMPKDHKNYFRGIINSLEVGAWLTQNRGLAGMAITKLYRYGASISDFSSDFLKVY